MHLPFSGYSVMSLSFVKSTHSLRVSVFINQITVLLVKMEIVHNSQAAFMLILVFYVSFTFNYKEKDHKASCIAV